MNRVRRPTTFKTKTAAANIGDNLRTWRKIRGLRMEDLALKANVSRDTLSRLENGDPSVSFETVLNVCNMLGITEDVVTATDPFEHPYGRLRADEELPKRIRH
jgi:transcriptional regulator with XRE-family HTH domain